MDVERNSHPVALTVFTTFYEDGGYLDQTIASVLSQSFRDFEYLIINEGDSARSRRILETHQDPRIRIIDQAGEGATASERITRARNRGLSEARGELIAFIDADDCCEPRRFEQQVAFLRDNRDHVLVGSALRLIDEQSRTIGSRTYPTTDAEIRKRMLLYNCIAQPAVMARRQALLGAGGYTLEFAGTEDYDLWLRAGTRGKLHNLAGQLTAYRIHPEAGKNTRLKAAVRDSTRVKIHAIRRYGYPAGPLALASIAMHAGLLLLPSRLIFWLFKRLMVSEPTR